MSLSLSWVSWVQGLCVVAMQVQAEDALLELGCCADTRNGVLGCCADTRNRVRVALENVHVTDGRWAFQLTNTATMVVECTTLFVTVISKHACSSVPLQRHALHPCALLCHDVHLHSISLSKGTHHPSAASSTDTCTSPLPVQDSRLQALGGGQVTPCRCHAPQQTQRRP